MENSAGLSDLLAGQTEMEGAIRPTSVENLLFISAGALPPNPAELLGSQKMHDFLEQLREQFEFIFIDSSPLMAVSDAVFLSTMVDGTLLVVNRKTPKPLVRKARARLTIPHSKIVGMLLNRIDVHNNEYGGYYKQYHEYYSEDPTNGAATAYENGNGGPPHKRRLNGSSSAASDSIVNQLSGNGHSRRLLHVVRAKLTGAIGVLRSPVVAQDEMPAEIQNDAEPPADVRYERETSASAAANTRRNGKDADKSSEKLAATSKLVATQQVRHGRLPPDLLNFVREKLREAMGPLASYVLNEHIRALGESPESFPAARLEELVRRVSQEIFSDAFRQRFEKQMKNEIAKIPPR